MVYVHTYTCVHVHARNKRTGTSIFWLWFRSLDKLRKNPSAPIAPLSSIAPERRLWATFTSVTRFPCAGNSFAISWIGVWVAVCPADGCWCSQALLLEVSTVWLSASWWGLERPPGIRTLWGWRSPSTVPALRPGRRCSCQTVTHTHREW